LSDYFEGPTAIAIAYGIHLLGQILSEFQKVNPILEIKVVSLKEKCLPGGSEIFGLHAFEGGPPGAKSRRDQMPAVQIAGTIISVLQPVVGAIQLGRSISSFEWREWRGDSRWVFLNPSPTFAVPLYPLRRRPRALPVGLHKMIKIGGFFKWPMSKKLPKRLVV